jgi:hypothetical protein
MKTMLPWRPTLSKTLTKYVVKFEFLNDVIKKPKICYQLIFFVIEIYGETHCNTGQLSNKCVCHVRCIFISTLTIFFEKLQEAVYDDQALK